MTILDVVRIARSNLKLLLGCLLAGMLLAAGYTLTRPVTYETSATAQVAAGSSDNAVNAQMSNMLASGRASYYAQVAGSQSVSERIVKASNGQLSAGDFSIAGASSEGSGLIQLAASSSSAQKAQIAANLAANAVNDEIKRRETLGTTTHSTIYQVLPLQNASKPSVPSSPKWPINLAIGAAVGLLAGLVIVVLRKQLDSRIRYTNELETITNAGVLGVIPKAKNLATPSRGGLGSLGNTSEAFRMLRTNLRYVSADKPPRSLVITSAAQGEGKSTVAANLARVLAAAGQPVALVDTDLRRPVVHETFDVDNSVGLTEVLTGQATLNDVLQKGDHKNLVLITSGRIPPNPSELLGSRRMTAVIEALQERYFVILDAPPLLPVTDSGLLAVAADGAAVVYHYGKTHREQIALCTKILDQVGAEYFGSVLNMTPEKEMGAAIYGYGAGNYGALGSGYGYGYGQTDEAAEPDAPTPAPSTSGLLVDGPVGAGAERRLEQRNAPTSSSSAPATATSGSGVTPSTSAGDSSTDLPQNGAHVAGRDAAGHVGANDAGAPDTEWQPNAQPPSRRSLRHKRRD